MPAPPVDEDVDVDSARLFTDSARSLLGRKFFRRFRLKPRIRVGVLLTRNIGTDAQTFDALMRLDSAATEPFWRAADRTGATPLDALTSWATLAIGDWGTFSTGEVAGNVVATLPSAAPAFSESVFEVHQILITLDTDATVATRTIVLASILGLPTTTPWSLVDFQRTMAAGQTAAENGSMFVPRAPGLVQENDNGTFATADVSPLPLLLHDAGTLTSTITNGVAGDVHTLSATVRRVA